MIRVVLLLFCGLAQSQPTARLQFLYYNFLPSSTNLLPLSYCINPKNYFDNITNSGNYTESRVAPQCGGIMANASEWDAYAAQSEQMLTAGGLNIYDGAVWTIALATNGYSKYAMRYLNETLLAGKSGQLANIKGDSTCKGDMATGQCVDPKSTGACGLCYGDSGPDRTMPAKNAWFFRMISAYFSFAGTTLALCPEKKLEWSWNDWRPILGENAWATLLGPLQLAWVEAGNDATRIDDDGVSMTLATNFVPSLNQMYVEAVGGVYYCPNNVYSDLTKDIGHTVSTENQASLYGGLKTLRYILLKKPSSKYQYLTADIDKLMRGIERYLQSAYDPTLGFFRQGGHYNPTTKVWRWSSAPGVPQFATDCQTWVSAVLGAKLIDAWFGEGTTFSIWRKTKQLAGYKKSGQYNIVGLGFTDNEKDQVFSSEWTYGAINWLRVMQAESYTTNTTIQNELGTDIQSMIDGIKRELWEILEIPKHDKDKTTTTVQAAKYANKRYYIPFGWWANSIPSTAGTAWSVLTSMKHNPFILGGMYISQYPDMPPPDPKPAPTPPPLPTPLPTSTPAATPPSPPPSPTPIQPGCKQCQPGAVCCDPTAPIPQLCPGSISCCNCGTDSCLCPAP